jgi:mannose-6-phosphate isomerase-like protein (cupin superfamily)
MIEVILPPGKGSLLHYHPEVEEVYYLLWGEAEMEVDGQVEMVGPGDVVVIPPGSTHHIRSLSDKEVILLATCAPAWMPGCEVRV